MIVALAFAQAVPAQAAERVTHPPDRTGSFVARLVVATQVRTAPAAGTVLQRLDPSRMPASLLVVSERTVAGARYLHVVVSRRGRRDGWIRADHAELAYQPYMVELDRGARVLQLYRAGRRVLRSRVVIGAAATPTPVGLFAVHQTVTNGPSDPLGPATIQLTALSEVLHEFEGGPGRIAIHGMRGSLVAPLGSRVSHGCVRIPNRPVQTLARLLPAGAPVRIRTTARR